MNNKKIPQYHNNFLWKDYDFVTGEQTNHPISTLEAMENYINYSLYYPFSVCNEEQHQHDFYMVIKFVFDYPDSFYLKAEDKKRYSQSQLEFIERLIKKCKEDGLKDIRKKDKNNFIYNVEEMKKRNYEVDDIRDV